MTNASQLASTIHAALTGDEKAWYHLHHFLAYVHDTGTGTTSLTANVKLDSRDWKTYKPTSSVPSTTGTCRTVTSKLIARNDVAAVGISSCHMQ